MNDKIYDVDEIVKIVMENDDVSDALYNAVMDRNLEMLKKRKAYEDGIEVGVKQGIEQGIEKGIEKGKEQGSKEKQIEMAKKMLEENMSIEIIMKITGLTKEEIENL
jgi:predicted transposase/invertase (TIGR01784 family)